MRAHVLHFLGRFAESIEEYQLIAAEYEASPDFGASSHHTLMCREALAGELFRAGRPLEALDELDAVIPMRSRMESVGPLHLITSLDRRMRASVLASLGRVDEALDELDELVDAQTESLGADDPATAGTIELRRHLRHRWQQELTDAIFSSVGRNEVCPCGSNKKFKHCHGRLS